MNFIETDIQKATLKEIIQASPEYFRIMVKENKIIAKSEVYQKIGKDQVKVWVWRETDIPITLSVGDSQNGLTLESLAVINLHWMHAKTFLTLLAHKPDYLAINYYNCNNSQLNKESGLNNEGIFIKALFKGKPKKEYEIEISQEYKSDLQKNARS